MSITIALGISHAPWIEGRTESFNRLREQLGLQDVKLPWGVIAYHEERERMPNPEWSERLWRWAVGTDATHCLFLQDDVRVCPEFFEVLRAMIAAHPDEVIALQTLHAMAKLVMTQEERRWITTCDGLVGTGYVWPRKELAKFLEWRATKLTPDALEFNGNGQVNLTEDTMQGLYCMLTGRRIFHPIPTIIDHDVTLKSSYGNEAHANRRSAVTWEAYPDIDLADADAWRGPVSHAGRFYEVSPFIARKYVKGVSDEDFHRMRSDDGTRELRRLNHVRLARGLEVSPTRILVATPIRGGLSPGYAHSINLLKQDPTIELVDRAEVSDPLKWQEDVVRIRSRYVNFFLHQTDATHLLFIDSDIIFEPRTVRGMLAAGKDFVTCPYPRRDYIDFEKAALVSDVPRHAVAYRYSLHPLPGVVQLVPGDDGCVEIQDNAMGMTLLTRSGLEQCEAFYKEDRVDYSREAGAFIKEHGTVHTRAELVEFAQHIAKLARDNPTLAFEDESRTVRGGRVPSVALFQLMMRDKGLLSEDFSFCRRWRDMGGKIWLYLGLGSPVSHEGDWIFQGALEAFGLQRDLG